MSEGKSLFLVPRLQEYLQVGVGEDGIERAQLWGTIAEEAALLSGRLRQAELTGYYSKAHATSFCSAFSCMREVAFQAGGYTQTNRPDWRAQNVFLTGYAAEVKLKALLIHAGFKLDTAVSFPLPKWVTPDGHQVHVQPDGILELNDDERAAFFDIYGWASGARVAIELKSIASKGFYRVQSHGLQAEKPGYYDQAQLEMKGSGCWTCIVLLENKDNQELMEAVVDLDRKRCEELYWLFKDVYSKGDPFAFDRVCAPEDVVIYKSKKNAPDPLPANAIPRQDKNERVYGYDIPTGESQLPWWPAAYCPYRELCWSECRVVEQFLGDKLCLVAVAKEDEKEVVF